MNRSEKWSWAVLFFLWLLGNVHATIYSTVATYNGSTFWQFCNNGGIENCTWLNASSGLARISNGDNLSEGLSRFEWARFQEGYGVVNGNNFAFTQFDNMSAWATSNLTTPNYWQADSADHEIIGSHAIDALLRYSQFERDNTIAYHFEVNSTPAFNFPQETFFAIAMLDVDIGANGNCDSIMYSTTAANGTFSQQSLCTDSRVMLYNVTSLKVQDYALGKAWDFDFSQNVSSFVFLKPQHGQHGETINAQIYIAFSIGRQLIKTAVDFQAIDAICSISCGPGDAVHVFFDSSGFPGANQVAENYTVGMSWYDDLGTCSISNCPLIAYSARTDNNVGTAYYQLAGYNNTNSWTVCDLANTTPEYQCENGVAARSNPQKGVVYTIALTSAGRYNRPAGFLHLVGVNLGGSAPCTGCNDVVLGSDTVRPLMPYFYINGQLFANNSIVNVPSTNGSTAYANFTASIQFGYPDQDFGGPNGNGTLNSTGIRLNRTGWGFNVSSNSISGLGIWAPSYYQSVLYEAQRNSTVFTLCAFANGTNRGTGTADSNFSITNQHYCWWATLNIQPIPAKPSPTMNSAFTPFLIEDDEEDSPIFIFFIIFLVLAALSFSYDYSDK